jgi:phenylalanyl-tRNA synthetase alpha chain|tara:strand:- start:659 stop:2179 length:1521 start_codon:yes stop_codon:yes gene_type:complete
MDLRSIVKKLHPLERSVVPTLGECKTVEEIQEKTNLQEIEVIRALQWLGNKKIVELDSAEDEVIDVDINGKAALKDGLPEKKLLAVLKSSIVLDQAVQKSGLSREEFNIALGVLKRKAALFITKEKDIVLKLMPAGKAMLKQALPEEEFLANLPKKIEDLDKDEKNLLKDLKKRKNLVKTITTKRKTFVLTDLGKELIESDLEVEGIIDSLTSQILKEKSWKNKTFREYDVTINVPKIYGGKRHIVSQAIEYIKKIWIEMGFEEQSGGFVQTSFWDLDALFVPQDHPARAMQDTFYIKDPAMGKLPALAKKVKSSHEGGVAGSTGWGGNWSEEVAKKNLLITHDTYLSAKVLANLKPEDIPKKTFQVMKVFRNEVLDWKHLFEFYQIGGIVVDEDANFRNLLGYLKQFFRKMGYKDVRLRPAHFPYTEPSCEIEVFHPIKKQWVELGGSGIFRPELVKPLLGKDVPVLAWGLGLERILTDYYEINDLREIYANDIKQLKEWKTFMK